MNKMKDVAKLLDLKIGERFSIKGVKNRVYWLGMRGIYTLDDKKEREIKVPSEIIIDLLMHTDKVIKLPWFPKEDEDYFLPEFISSVDDLVSLYKKGFLCKTHDDAEKLYLEIIKTARKFNGFEG